MLLPENIDDKGYRRMLSKKRNFLEFIKQHVAAGWTERLSEHDLELVNSSFVTSDFKDRESDIIYKAKINGEDVFFFVLLELQSDVDFTMPFRFLVYMVEMLRRLFNDSAENTRKQKSFRLPAVVPVVLYNGDDEWSCVRSFKEYLAGYELFAPHVIDFEYIMINVNAPDEEDLIKMPTLVNLAMLLDRKGDAEKMLNRLKTALRISKRLTAGEREELYDWIRDVLLKKARVKVDEDVLEEIRESSEGENEMTYALERVIDEVERKAEARAEARARLEMALEMAMAMVNDGDSVERAARISGISVEQLEQYL
jgi:predicted transposase/invertase (TIGR01784 family)